jgi:alkyl sulfatase BDS1-like metallo-beta-lactamase superfamily hydrolase
MVFQMAPGTEAPAEMHFYFPDRRALCMAENATHNLHNLLTLRGALVRDPHVWAYYLTEAIELFAGQSDVVFASHHWPTWGTANIIEFLSLVRTRWWPRPVVALPTATCAGPPRSSTTWCSPTQATPRLRPC